MRQVKNLAGTIEGKFDVQLISLEHDVNALDEALASVVSTLLCLHVLDHGMLAWK